MSATSSTLPDERVAFAKVVEDEKRPSGEAANSAVYHRKYPSALVDKRSSKAVWAYDPEEDSEAMDLLAKGLKALFPPAGSSALPDATRAVQLFNKAIRRRPDSQFERAWLNMGIALVVLRKLDQAEKIFRLLIAKVEQSGEWRMTSEARSMVHHNLGQVHYLHAAQTKDAPEKAHLEEAHREYGIADALDGYNDSSRLLSWLVVEVALGKTGEQADTIRRIHNYVRQHGDQALEIIAEYQAKYPSLKDLSLAP